MNVGSNPPQADGVKKKIKVIKINDIVKNLDGPPIGGKSNRHSLPEGPPSALKEDPI